MNLIPILMPYYLNTTYKIKRQLILSMVLVGYLLAGCNTCGKNKISAMRSLTTSQDPIIPAISKHTFIAKGGHQVMFTDTSLQGEAIVQENTPPPFSREMKLRIIKEDFSLTVQDLEHKSADWCRRCIHICFPEQDPQGKGYVYVGTNYTGLPGGMKNNREDGEMNVSEVDLSDVCLRDEKAVQKAFLKRANSLVGSANREAARKAHQKYPYKDKGDACPCKKCGSAPNKQDQEFTSKDNSYYSQIGSLSQSGTPIWQGKIGSIPFEVGFDLGAFFSTFFSSGNDRENQRAERLRQANEERERETQRMIARLDQLGKRSAEEVILEVIEKQQEEAEYAASKREAAEAQKRIMEIIDAHDPCLANLIATQGIKAVDKTNTSFSPHRKGGYVRLIETQLSTFKRLIEKKETTPTGLSEHTKEITKKILQHINQETAEIAIGAKIIEYQIKHPSMGWGYNEEDLQLANKHLEDLARYKQEIYNILIARGENPADYDPKKETSNKNVGTSPAVTQAASQVESFLKTIPIKGDLSAEQKKQGMALLEQVEELKKKAKKSYRLKDSLIEDDVVASATLLREQKQEHKAELKKLRQLREQLKTACKLTKEDLATCKIKVKQQEGGYQADSSDEEDPLSRAGLAFNRGVLQGIGIALQNAPRAFVESLIDLLTNPSAAIEGIVEGLNNLTEVPGLIFEYLETIEGDEETKGVEIADFITSQLATILSPNKVKLINQLSKGKLGAAALQVANKARKFWKLTQEGAVGIKVHKGIYGKFYKSKSDGLWWSVDIDKHGGSKFKVFKETNKGLEWIKDTDEYGNFILNKHKGPQGLFISWEEFKTIK